MFEQCKREWSEIPALTFPAIPAPQPQLRLPQPLHPQPQPPSAPVAPVGKFQQGGGRLQCKTVNMYVSYVFFSMEAVDPWTFSTVIPWNRWPCTLLMIHPSERYNLCLSCYGKPRVAHRISGPCGLRVCQDLLCASELRKGRVFYTVSSSGLCK